MLVDFFDFMGWKVRDVGIVCDLWVYLFKLWIEGYEILFVGIVCLWMGKFI